MLSQLGAVQMAVDTHLAVLATVALYVILCIEVRCPPSTLCTLSTLYLPIYLYYPLPTSTSTAHLLIKTNRPLLTACVLPTVITTDFLLRVLTRYPPRSRPTCSSSRRSSARSANTPSTRAPRPSTTSTLCSGDLPARSLHA